MSTEVNEWSFYLLQSPKSDPNRQPHCNSNHRRSHPDGNNNPIHKAKPKKQKQKTLNLS